MKTKPQHRTPNTSGALAAPKSDRGAFTLIELLVVIAIIAILAAMVIPITGAVKRAKVRSRTEAELAQIETAILQYKNKHGFYPPDNPGGQNYINQLYYELSGTTNNGSTYTTLDRSASIDASAIPTVFNGKNGFMNTMLGKAGDEGIIAENFLKPALKSSQLGAVTLNGVQFNIIVGSVGWPAGAVGEVWPGQPAGAAQSYNPWRYNSSNPTNNPTSFDLWIDILVDNKTNRFCNWSDKYLKL